MKNGKMLLGDLFGHYICSPSCLASALLEAMLGEPWVKDVAVAGELAAGPKSLPFRTRVFSDLESSVCQPIKALGSHFACYMTD